MPKNAKGTYKLENGTNKYTLCFVPLSENGTKNYLMLKNPKMLKNVKGNKKLENGTCAWFPCHFVPLENAKECQRD